MPQPNPVYAYPRTKSWKRDSNPRPTDYESVALPTALFQHNHRFAPPFGRRLIHYKEDSLFLQEVFLLFVSVFLNEVHFVFCKLSIIQSPTGIFYPGSHHMCLCDGSFFGYKPAYNTSFSKHANVRRHISSRAPGAVKSWPQPGIMCSSICGY